MEPMKKMDPIPTVNLAVEVPEGSDLRLATAQPPKEWYRSATVWGLVVVVGGALLEFFGMGSVDLAPLADGVQSPGELIQILGSVLAAYGLRRAVAPLRKKS